MEVSLKDLKELFGCSTTHNPYPSIGTNVFIRTVTMHYTGRLVEVGPQELVLEDAAWIADSGRFAEFLKTGVDSETEPFPEGRVVIGRGAIIDCSVWRHPLLRSTK